MTTKDDLRKMLDNTKRDPTRDKIVALKKGLLQYVDAKLADADAATNENLTVMSKDFDILKDAKAASNASVVQMQKELDAVKNALAACKATAETLSKRAQVINSSIKVVDEMRSTGN